MDVENRLAKGMGLRYITAQYSTARIGDRNGRQPVHWAGLKASKCEQMDEKVVRRTDVGTSG